jgi:hypothetical protein
MPLLIGSPFGCYEVFGSWRLSMRGIERYAISEPPWQRDEYDLPTPAFFAH